MTEKLQNVAVIGASGNLGAPVVQELIAAKINTTAVSRKDSDATFPSEVKVARTDYSLDSLVDIFKGQDAVLCLMSGYGKSLENTIVDASIKAGVKRYFPSEFGTHLQQPGLAEKLPMFQAKVDLVNYLKSKESTGLTWTAISTGLFIDWDRARGLLDIDYKNRTAELWNDGQTKFTGTKFSTIGKAIASILTNPEVAAATANQYVAIESFTVTQREIIAACEEITGDKFQLSAKNEEDEYAKAREGLAQGNQMAAIGIIKYLVLGPESWGDNRKAPGGVWNDKLHLPKDDLKEMLKTFL